MAGETRNLGQVSGVFIGTTPPENTTLIWFDSTPSQRCHKVYDPSLNTWVILNQGIISSITYSELESIATGVGLSVGKFYQIRDRGNALAVAITSTKIQYADSLGNILIDDLGTNIQYHVTSSNLLIDDVAGVFDSVNKKLVFQFNQETPDFNEDFLMGKAKRSNIWKLVKYKISSFLSTVSGNSITWNNGFFFNFTSAFNAKLDVAGGAVAKDTYDVDQAQIAQDIENVASENQQIIANANAAIANATTNTAIYGKRLPSISTAGEPVDIAAGDTLNTLISKIQRFINRFKFATGVRMSLDFTDNVPTAYVNNNDTVDSAIRKLQNLVKGAAASSVLSSDWEPLPYDEDIPDVAPGDTLDEAFAKAVGKLNQIGDISNGKIESKEKTIFDGVATEVPVTIFNIKEGGLEFKPDGSDEVDVENEVSVKLNRKEGLKLSGRGGDVVLNPLYSFLLKTRNHTNVLTLPDYFVGQNAEIATMITCSPGSFTYGNGAEFVAALSAELTGYKSGDGRVSSFDAFFGMLKAGSISLGLKWVQSDETLGYDASFIFCGNPSSIDLNLPGRPSDGMVLFIYRNSADVVIHSNGNYLKVGDSAGVSSKTLGTNGQLAMLVFRRTVNVSTLIEGYWYANIISPFT